MRRESPLGSRLIITPQEFLSEIDAINEAHTRHENFCNLIQAMYYMIAQPTAPTAEHWDALEAGYMRTIDVYQRDPETLRRMCELGGRLQVTLGATRGDFLGRAYMMGELAAKNSQEFTPCSISGLATLVMLDRETLEHQLEEQGHIQFTDPACGSGAMAIAQAERLRQLGFDPARIMMAVLTDVSELCVQMTYLQMTYKGIAAACIHANTLLGQEYGRAITISAALQLGLPVRRIDESPPRAG